jgi:hypothetical protein
MSDKLHLLSPRTPPLPPLSPAASPLPPLDLYDSDIERWGGGRATDDDDESRGAGDGAGLLRGLSSDLSNYKRRLSMSLNSVAETVLLPHTAFFPHQNTPPPPCKHLPLPR